MCLCVYMCVVPPILVFVVGWSCCVCGVNKKTNSDTWLGFPGVTRLCPLCCSVCVCCLWGMHLERDRERERERERTERRVFGRPICLQAGVAFGGTRE